MSAETTPKASNWNLPNVLTTLRIVAVPFYGWLLLAHGGDDATWRIWAALLFMVAMITDKIDGDYARKHNLITDFGKIADPIADKALTGMALVGLSIIGEVWWWVTILILVREWSVTLLRLSVLSRIVIAADQLGKVKTFVQGVALAGLSFPLVDDDAPHWWHLPGTLLHWGFEACLGVAFGLTMWSGFEFFVGVWKQRHQLRGDAGA